MATNAEAYEVSTYETDGPSFHFVEPISPVDPFDIAPRTRPTTPTRQTQGTDFFEAVYLDSPFGANGTTRPLRVRKKSAANARIAGIGPSSTLFVFVTIYDKLMHRQVTAPLHRINASLTAITQYTDLPSPPPEPYQHRYEHYFLSTPTPSHLADLPLLTR